MDVSEFAGWGFRDNPGNVRAYKGDGCSSGRGHGSGCGNVFGAGEGFGSGDGYGPGEGSGWGESDCSRGGDNTPCGYGDGYCSVFCDVSGECSEQ